VQGGVEQCRVHTVAGDVHIGFDLDTEPVVAGAPNLLNATEGGAVAVAEFG
jgi:hypothetical protein